MLLTAAASLLATGSVRAGDDDDRSIRRQRLLMEAKFNPLPSPQQPRQPSESPRMRIDVEPPSKEKLFSVSPEKRVISNMEKEFKASEPNLLFLIPGTQDNFDNSNVELLGPNWVQKLKVGADALGRGEKIGVMGVVKGMGQYPLKEMPKAPPDAAVFLEAVATADLEVAVEVNLGAPTNEFGVLFAAKTPDAPLVNVPAGTVVDPLKSNTFYFAVASADRIELQKLEEGKPTRLGGASVAPKTLFRLSAAISDGMVRVFRDGEEVLHYQAKKGDPSGSYVGLIGLRAEGSPVKFDNFQAQGYGGIFEKRMYAASMEKFHGPNVHYNPLRFEQRALERYGHHFGNLAAPFVAHGLFFLDFAFLPASIGVAPPWECHSGDLFARPGDLVPFHITPPVIETKSIAMQLGTIALIAAMAP